jgi:OmpA-OmpF porin, OOP family
MKHGVLTTVILLVLISTSSKGQRRTVFQETFDSNDKEWLVGESGEGRVDGEIDDGVYRMTVHDDGGWWYRSNACPITNQKNWTLTVRLREVDGSTDNPFGFVYMAKDADNLYEFSIISDGKARVRRYKEGELTDIVELHGVSAVKPQGEWNVLQIRKVNDALTYWVNDAYVGGISASFWTVLGGHVGPFVQWQHTIEYDDITLVEWDMEPIDVVQGADPRATPVNLGPAINSTADELVDAIAPDGSMLMFSRTGHPDNTDEVKYSDVWFSTRNADGSWAKAENPGRPINTGTHNFGVALSQDLNSAYVQGVYYDDGTSTTSGGVSESRRLRNGWSMPRSMVIDDFYNRSAFLNSHISPNGQVLLLSVRRDDSYGGNDLYVCFRTKDDSWSKPKNIGNVVNSIGDETGPFIAGDGKTVYFASNGHPGYEGKDIYVTVRQDDTWLTWSKPRNLG